MSIEDDVKINKYKMEEECEIHPSLYYQYSEESVDARADRDKAKNHLKEVMAKVEIDYRTGKREVETKLTEAAISSYVEIDPDVVSAKRAFFEAEKRANRAQSHEDCMRQRKSMLDNLIQLYTMNYYSEPNGKKGIRENSAGDDVRKGLNKKEKE